MRALGAGSEIDVGDRIDYSMLLDSVSSQYLSRTPGVAGNRTTWTWSGWVKRSAVGAVQTVFGQGSGTGSNGYFLCRFLASDTLQLHSSPDGGVADFWWDSTAVFRDVTGWFHLLVVLDTTNATAADRLAVYVNRVRVPGAFSPSITQSASMQFNRAAAHQIGATNTTGLQSYFEGYVSNIYFIDGQALTPFSFGRVSIDTNAWVPKNYTGTYGTNGYFLGFNNATNLGLDTSGNGNHWATNGGISSINQVKDSQYNNYCTLNSINLQASSGGGTTTLSKGNLQAVQGIDNSGNTCASTLTMFKGKWYAEAKLTVNPTPANSRRVGIILENATLNTVANSYVGDSVFGYSYSGSGTGVKINNNSVVAYGTDIVLNDVVGICFDADLGTLEFYKNGISQGVAYTGIPSGAYYFASSAATQTWVWNFGQSNFAYTPPTGYKALCTRNIAHAKILKPSRHFDTVTWTSNATDKQIDLGFIPDFVWAKRRDSTGSHYLYDTSRGYGNHLSINNDSAEAFLDNGLDFDNGPYLDIAGSKYFGGGSGGSPTFVAWNWKASNAPFVTNTAGSLTSQVSVNAAAGFSIVNYTPAGVNATVGHGLGVAPSFIWVKNRNSGSATAWISWFKGFTGNEYMQTSGTISKSTSSTAWNSTVPTSQVFSIGTTIATNEAGKNFVAYCFAEVPGYSKIGIYTGNGSSNGTFVHCGFRPRWILTKRADTTAGQWAIHDTTRDPFNGMFRELCPGSSVMENDAGLNIGMQLDITSTGFKLRNTDASGNASGVPYAFYAIADVAAQYSNAR